MNVALHSIAVLLATAAVSLLLLWLFSVVAIVVVDVVVAADAAVVIDIVFIFTKVPRITLIKQLHVIKEFQP